MKSKLTKSLTTRRKWHYGVALSTVVFLVFLALVPSAAQQKNSKRITGIRLGTAAEGSRVSVLSDTGLNDYEAFRRGDRFYVRIPAADFVASQPLFRGSGFQEVQVQKIGDSIVISFWLQPGASAHVEQRANKLDVVFASAGGGSATPATSSVSTNSAGRSRWSGPQSQSQPQSQSTSRDQAGPMPAGSVGRNYDANSSSRGSSNSRPETTRTDPGANSATKPATSSASPESANAQQSNSSAATTPNAASTTDPNSSSTYPSTSSAPATSASTTSTPAATPTYATPATGDWRNSYVMQWYRLNKGIAIAIAIAILLAIALLAWWIVSRIRRRPRPEPKVVARKLSKPKSGTVSPVFAASVATPMADEEETVTVMKTPMPEAPPAEPRKAPATQAPAIETPIPAPFVTLARRTTETPATPAVAEPVSHSPEAKDLISEQPSSSNPINYEQADAEVRKLLSGGEYNHQIVDAKDALSRQVVAAALLSAITSRNPEHHDAARRAFMDHGYFDEATRDLRTADSPAQRAAAARKLGVVGTTSGTPHLVAALHDSAPEVRRCAVESMGQIGDSEALPALNELLLRENSRQVPEAVIRHAINSIQVTEAKHASTTERPNLRIVERPKPAPDAEEREAFFEFVDGLNQRDPSLPLTASSLLAATPVDPPPPAPLPSTQSVQEKLAAEEQRLRQEEEALRRAADELENRKRESEMARLRAEEEARLKLHQEDQLRREVEARMRAEEEARRKAELEAQLRAEVEVRMRAEEEVRRRAAEEARRVEEEARLRAEEDVRRRAAEEAARRLAEEEARIRVEQDERVRLEAAALLRAEEEARGRAEQEERVRIEAASRLRAEEEARFQLEAQTLRRAAEELARKRAVAEAARKAAEEEESLRVEEEMRRKVEEEMRRRAEEEARIRAEVEVKRRLEEEVRLRAEAEARRLSDEARIRAEAESEAKRLAEVARLRAEAEVEERFREEARKQAEAEARRKALEEARLQYEEEQRLKVEVAARRQAEEERRLQEERLRREAEERRAVEARQLQMEQDALADAAAELVRRRSEIEMTRRKTEEEARLLAEARERVQAEEEAALRRVAEERERLEAEANRRVEEERQRLEEARRVAEENQRQVEEEARRQAQEEEQRLMDLEALRKKTEEESRRRAEQEQRIRSEIDALRRAEEEQRRRIEAETQRRIEVEARLKEEQEREQAEEQARRKAEAEAERMAEEGRSRAEQETQRRVTEALLREQEERRQADEAVSLRAQEEAQRLAQEARRLEEEAARSKAEEEQRARAEEESMRRAETEAKLEQEHSRTQQKELHAEPEIDVILVDEFEVSQDDPIEIEDLVASSGSSDMDVAWVDVKLERNEEVELPVLPDEPALEIEHNNIAAPTAEHPHTNKSIDVVREEKGIIAVDDGSGIPAELIKRLNAQESSERSAALADLARYGSDDAFHHISKAFDDQSPDVRNAAARALYSLHPDRAASFTRALREGTSERRRRIGSALAASGLASDAVANLTGESREKTYDAFSLLFLMAKAGEVQPLMKAIEDYPNIEVRLAVVKLLALSGQPEIVPAFRRLAVRGSLPSEVRSAVMEAIYQISSQTRETTSSAA